MPEIMKELTAMSGTFREMRNRILAHRDWATRNQPRPVTKKNEIDKALGLSARIMKRSERPLHEHHRLVHHVPVHGGRG